MIQSFIIYGFTIVLTSIFTHFSVAARNKFLRRICVALAILVPTVLSGLRYNVGTDYKNYFIGFLNIQNGIPSRFEIGFQYLNKLLSFVGFGPQSIYFASTLIMMCFIYKAIYDQRSDLDVGVSMAIFMMVFFQSSFNITRCMIAVAICLYNLKHIRNGKLIPFLIFSCLALSFHLSAIVFFPLYFLRNYALNSQKKMQRILLYFFTAILITYFSSILKLLLSYLDLNYLSYYAVYMEEVTILTGSVFKRIIFYFPIILPVLFIGKEDKETNTFSLYFFIVVIGFIIEIFSVFLSIYVNRITNYFLISIVFLLPTYKKIFSRNCIANLGLWGWVTAYWVFIYFVFENNETIPYQWIL